MLEDIATLTNGKAITEDLGLKLEGVKLEDLGKAKKVNDRQGQHDDRRRRRRLDRDRRSRVKQIRARRSRTRGIRTTTARSSRSGSQSSSAAWPSSMWARLPRTSSRRRRRALKTRCTPQKAAVERRHRAGRRRGPSSARARSSEGLKLEGDQQDRRQHRGARD